MKNLNFFKNIATIVITLLIGFSMWAMEEKTLVVNHNEQFPVGIPNYLKQLPTLHADEDRGNMSHDITEFLKQFSNASPTKGQDVIESKITTYVKNNQPIELMIIGFPCKSDNTQNKVLDACPDLGECTAFFTLQHICKQIEKIHKPGAHITVYTQEPFVHEISDIFQKEANISFMSKQSIECYQQAIKNLSNCFEPHIHISNIPDVVQRYKQEKTHNKQKVEDVKQMHYYTMFMKEELDNDQFKNALEKKLFEEKQDMLVKCFGNSKKPGAQEFITAMQNNVSFQEISHMKFYKNNVRINLELRRHSKEIAQQMANCALKGAVCMRVIMQQQISDYDNKIRLSIHGGDDMSKKIGIDLVHGSSGTPWHKTPVVTEDGITLMSRKQAIKKGSIQRCKINGQTLAYIAAQK